MTQPTDRGEAWGAGEWFEGDSTFIGGEWMRAAGERRPLVSALTGQEYGATTSSPWEHLDKALSYASSAADVLIDEDPERIGRFLDTAALRIEEQADELAGLAHFETGLPLNPRLRSVELPAAVSQMRQGAEAARSRAWTAPTLSPSARIAAFFAPIPGPVVVLGPNNFPFRFNSVCGGDFVAAIASRHPVVAKAHPAYPATTRLLASLAVEALESAGLPAATIQMLYDVDFSDGERLVADPRLAATAFTGGKSTGLRLKEAAERSGNLIYLEMASLNPVVVLDPVDPQRALSIGEELGASVTNGMGQFCTKPGLIFADRSSVDRIAEGIVGALGRVDLHPMIGGCSAYSAGVDQLVRLGARVAYQRRESEESLPSPTLLQVSAEQFLGEPTLHGEVFGPCAVLVSYEDGRELLECLSAVPGSLAGSIYGGDPSDEGFRQVVAQMRRRVGRLLVEKVPTGVDIVSAMAHGGPFPSTGHPGFTAVGYPGSMRRFAMWQSYDNVPDILLPEELQAANPLGIQRFVDGRWTDAPVVWGRVT